MSTKIKEPSESDVIVARALSSYAQLRASIASWSGSPVTNAAEDTRPNDYDEELFTAESETAGVGYVAPADGVRSKTTTDKLRKQMLGNRARDKTIGLERVGGPKKVDVPRKGGRKSVQDNDDSEEDEGRSGLGKRRKHMGVRTETLEDTKTAPVEANRTPSDGDTIIRKPPSSYLDELLAERSKKRKKKKSKVKNSA